MGRQEARKHKMFTAYFALEGFFTRMKIFVFQCMGANCESFITNLAFITRCPLVCSNVHLDMIFGSVAIVTNVTTIFSVVVMFNGMYGKRNVIFVGFAANLTLNGFV